MNLSLSALVHSRRMALCCLLLLATSAFCGEDKPPAPAPTPTPAPKTGTTPDKKADAPLPEVDWSAAKQSFIEDKDAVVLSGNAWVRYQGNKLEADNIVFFRQTREMYAEGNVRLRMGESEISAQNAYIDATNEVGYMIDANVSVNAPPTSLPGAANKSARLAAERKKNQEEYESGKSQTDKGLYRGRDIFGIYLLPVEDPQARATLMVHAQKVVQEGRLKFSIEDGFVTSDDMVHPMYGVKAGHVDLYLYEVQDKLRPEKKDLKPQKLVVKRAQINILGQSLFPFPTLTYDMEKRNQYFDSHFGKSTSWGYYIQNRFGYNLGNDYGQIFDPTHVYLDLDERQNRGPAIGGELDWQTGRRPDGAPPEKHQNDRGDGHIRVYVLDEIQIDDSEDLHRARRELDRRIQPIIDGYPRRVFDANLLFEKRRELDNAGPPSFDLNPHGDDFRGFVDFQQHQPLQRFAGIDNLLLDLKFQRESDRDFMHEYFHRDYSTQDQPEALASLRKPGDNYSMELLYRSNPQDFDGAPPRSPLDHGTFTNYDPALTYSLNTTPLPWGFYVTSELQAARLKREFERDIYNQDRFLSDRAYAIVDFSRPIKWGCLNFVPHLGTQQQVYDNARDGSGTSQGALTYGFDLVTRGYGTFQDFENEALGINGMRHIIEPRISYNAVGDTRVNPEDLLDFDPIDDLQHIDRVTFALDQTFQTKRAAKDGTMKSYNFAGFDMAMDWFPRQRDQDRLLHGDSLDLLRMQGYLRVMDLFRVGAGIGLRPEDFRAETAVYSITIDPQTNWTLSFSERYSFTDSSRAIFGSDQTDIKFQYQMSERWGFSIEEVNERKTSLLNRKGRQRERISLTRSYGALNATLSYTIDNTLGQHTIFASVSPTATYRNLVLPSQDLLVHPGEVGDFETPEEHNFDPFELMKQRKNKMKGRVPPGGTAPAPAPIKDNDVPVPPPPGASNLGATGKEAALFRDPDAPAPVNVSNRDAGLFKDPNATPKKTPRKVDDDDWTTPPATPASTREKK